MKRLIILLIACVAVFGNISAQNEHSARRAAKLHQDSLVNYEIWLKDIAGICISAQEDLKANKRAWKNPNDSRAEVFVRQLENCSYYHRADKDWSVPYIEDIIQRAISRIRAYKTTQSAPMKFDDIIPAEFLPEKPKVVTSIVQQTEPTPTEDMMGKIKTTISGK